MKNIFQNSYRNPNKKIHVLFEGDASIKTALQTASSAPQATNTSIDLSYSKGHPSNSSHHLEPISTTVYYEEAGGVVSASGTVDDSVSLSVDGQAAAPLDEGGAAHPFNMSVTSLKAGYSEVSLSHINIDKYPYPPGNVSLISGTLVGNFVDPIPDDNVQPCDDPCGCEENPMGDGGGSGGGQSYPSPQRSHAALAHALTPVLSTTPNYTSSSAGQGTSATIINEALRWSTSFASFRGLGAIPRGLFSIVAQQFDARLLSAESLTFKHPLAASIITEDDTGIVPNKAIRLFIGADYTNYICNASGMKAFSIGASKGQTQRLNFVRDMSCEDGNNILPLEQANYLRVLNQDSSALFFSVPDAQLVGYLSSKGSLLTGIDAMQYLVTVRDEETGIIRQIVNYWDGLADIVPAPAGQLGYSIKLYTNAQVGDFDEASGLFPTTGTPFKEFVISGSVEEQRLSIEEIDYSIELNVEPLMTSWNYSNGAWTLVRGTGTDAITETHTKEILTPTADNPANYRVIKTLSKTDAEGNTQVASCTATDYQSSTVGELALRVTQAYGSAEAQTTVNTYNHYTGQLISSVEHNGAEYRYSSDSRGRTVSRTRPWADGGVLVSETSYMDDGSIFAEEIHTQKEFYQLPDGNFAAKTTSTYSYSLADSVKRVEISTTAGGSSETQLKVTETWMGDAPNVFARGRTKMTQAVNGVQTWHEYAATALHGALYTHIQETRVEGELVAGQSERSVSYVDQQGNTTREEEYALLPDNTWALINGANHSYDVQNRRVGTQYDNGRSTSRALICNGRVLWEIDENGIRTDYAYDNARTLIETTRAATPTTPESISEWVKDAAGRTLQTRKHIGAMISTESTTYDALGRAISQTDILGRITSTAYSADALTVTTTTANGATLINRNNKDGSIAEQSGTGQRHLIYAYDVPNGRLRQTVKLADDETILSQELADGFGNIITITEPTTEEDGYVYTRSRYNEKGQLDRQQRGTLAPHFYFYDSMGNQTKHIQELDNTDPLNPTKNRIVENAVAFEELADGIYQVQSTTRYNAAGTALASTQKQLISKLSHELESKSISVDERGNPSSQRTLYTEALEQRQVETQVPSSDITATSIIVDGFTIEQIDERGGNFIYTRQYLSTGILTTTTDPRGITSSTQTDIAGRPIIQTDGGGNETTISYLSCCDQAASITDALGNTVNYSYDIRNRKVAEYGTGTQPATYSYDDANRMTTLTTYRVGESTITTDPTGRTDGDTTAYVYHDATGLLLSETKADGTVETRSYDNHNRLSTTTSARGNVTTHSYDTLTGELLTVSYSDSTPEKTYVYNHLGQVTSITDASGTHTFTYNEYSESLNSSQQVNTTNFAVVEQYDELGRSAGYLHKRATGDMQVITTGYDSKGRIGTASFKQGSEVKEFTYSYLEGTSLLSSLASPNGMTRELSYEAQRNLITDINDMRGTSGVSLREYTYDAIARPATRKISRKGTVRNDSFTYNAKSELITAAHGTANFAYDYDNIGNRKTAQEQAQEVTYDANTVNQYTAINSFVPEFDLDGNQTKLQTSTGIWNVEYNAENRPTKFTSENGNTIVEAAYDYMGRRAWKKVTSNGAITKHERYLYRGYLQIACIDLTRSTLNGLYYLIWDPSEPTATRPLALQRYGSWFTFGLDISKNVKELFNPSSSVVTTYDYSPFGAVSSEGSTKSPLQWSSEIADEELGLVYYNYRSYNPADGRWINRDPIAEEGGLNLYGFVGNRVWVWDVLGLVYDYCVLRTGSVTHQGNTITQRNFLFIEVSVKITTGRKCYFRCYYANRENCGHIPCPYPWCDNDHGVEILVKTRSKNNSKPATDCSALLEKVRSGKLTSGMTYWN